MPPKGKTNLLAARIKRVMQKDEDVGKIAGPAPIVMSKALELFVKQLVTTANDVAVLHGSKTVNGSHLKGAVAMVPEAFDFLSDIVEKAKDLGPPPDLRAVEAELKAAVDGKGTKRGGKKRAKKEAQGSLGDLDFGDGSLDADGEDETASTKRTSKAKPKAKGRAKKVKKEEDDFIDDDEEFVDEMSETDEEFDADAPVEPRAKPTRARSARAKPKKYVDDFVDEDEHEETPVKEEPVGTLASLDNPFIGGSLATEAPDVGEDEDDYD
jgi:histone H3/H4